MADKFREQLDAARTWEMCAAAWARSRGWYVLPTYDFSGAGDNKAPKLMAPERMKDLVLPDLQCFKDGEPRWLEIKWKARADWNRKRGYYVTGINKRLWDHYNAVEMQTNACVVIMFIHDREAEVRADTIANLRTYVSHTYDGAKMGRSGMVFWEYQRIPRWGGLEMLDAFIVSGAAHVTAACARQR